MFQHFYIGTILRALFSTTVNEAKGGLAGVAGRFSTDLKGFLWTSLRSLTIYLLKLGS